jgi:uncharacterized protein YjiS (DUF1127 family)
MSWITQPLAADLSALSAQNVLNKPARLAVKCAVLLTVWDRTYRTRQTLKQLTPDQLRDVGLTREEADREAQRPFFWR